LLITSISIIWFNWTVGETYRSNLPEFFLQLLLAGIQALICSSVLYLFVRELIGGVKNKGVFSLLLASAFLVSIGFKAANLHIITQEDKFNETLREIVSGQSFDKPSHENYREDVYGNSAQVLNLTKTAMEYPAQEVELFYLKIGNLGYPYFLNFENTLNYHYLMGSFGKIEDLLSSIDPLKDKIRNKLMEIEVQAKIFEINHQGLYEELFIALKSGNEKRVKISEQILDIHRSILLEIKELLSFLSNIYGSYWLENEMLVFSEESKMFIYNDSIVRIAAQVDELHDFILTTVESDQELQNTFQSTF